MSSIYHGKGQKIREAVATQRMKKGGRHKEHKAGTGEDRSTGTYARDTVNKMGNPPRQTMPHGHAIPPHSSHMCK